MRRASSDFEAEEVKAVTSHRSEEHTSELQSPCNLVCRLLLEKKHILVDIGEACDVSELAKKNTAHMARTHPFSMPTAAAASVSGAARGALCIFFFFFNDTATTEIYTLSLHDALPISVERSTGGRWSTAAPTRWPWRSEEHTSELQSPCNLVCRLLLEKKKNKLNYPSHYLSHLVNDIPVSLT